MLSPKSFFPIHLKSWLPLPFLASIADRSISSPSARSKSRIDVPPAAPSWSTPGGSRRRTCRRRRRPSGCRRRGHRSGRRRPTRRSSRRCRRRRRAYRFPDATVDHVVTAAVPSITSNPSNANRMSSNSEPFSSSSPAKSSAEGEIRQPRGGVGLKVVDVEGESGECRCVTPALTLIDSEGVP